MRVFLAYREEHGPLAGLGMLVVEQGIDDPAAHLLVILGLDDAAGILALEIHIHEHVTLRDRKGFAHVEHVVEAFVLFVDVPVVLGLLARRNTGPLP